MSGSESSVTTLAFAPVFVIQFGSRRNNNRRRKKRQDCNNSRNWHVCDSLLVIPSALSSSFSILSLIFLVILCSIGGDDGVHGSEISSSSSMAASNSYNNGVPTFDINDLKNLIEIFPEFREYVFRVVSSQVEKQQQKQQYGSSGYAVTATPAPVRSGNKVYDGGGTSPNSRNDFVPYSPQKDNGINAKHSHGWHYHDDYSNDYHHKPVHHGYGYGPPTHYGWSSESSHETYKDPKFHYQVGYQLGKDLSCLLGLLGFKSIKDFSIHSFFSFLKKLKYIVLIGLAFKLGVILSPIALPMLFPIILLAAIAKILPLLLIVVLLFKLLKTQLKLGIGKRNGESSGSDGISTVSNLLEGTSISRLWKSIDDVTQNVVDSESCVEKIICKMAQAESVHRNSTMTYDDMDVRETKRSILSVFVPETNGVVSKIVDWVFPTRSWKFRTEDGASSKVWECDKIQCDFLETHS